jgi:hypothetical protein
VEKTTLADPADTQRMRADLKGNANVVFSTEYANYSHLTWLVGTETTYIEDVKSLLQKYNRLSRQNVLV